MERANEQVGNKYNEDKSTEQGRIAGEGLRRQQGDAPTVGDGAVPQHDVVRESAPPPATTEDAQLNWASGNHVVNRGPYDPPFTAELARAAGVSGPGLERFIATPPALGDSAAGRRLTSVPLAVESNSGRALSGIDEICGHHDNSGRR